MRCPSPDTKVSDASIHTGARAQMRRRGKRENRDKNNIKKFQRDDNSGTLVKEQTKYKHDTAASRGLGRVAA